MLYIILTHISCFIFLLLTYFTCCAFIFIWTREMKSLKSKFKWFSYSSSKWVVKDQRQLAISTMHLAQELLVNVQSLIAQLVKNLPAIQEVWVWFLGWEDPLEKEMATHSSIRAWRIPRTEEPGGLQSMGSQWVGHDLVTKPPPPQRWFKKLCKEDESLEEHGAWPSKADQLRGSSKLILLQHRRSCWRTLCQPFYSHLVFEANWKGGKAQ